MFEISTFEKDERRDMIIKAQKAFNYLIEQYMKVHMHHKAWIEGMFHDLEELVEECKLGE